MEVAEAWSGSSLPPVAASGDASSLSVDFSSIFTFISYAMRGNTSRILRRHSTGSSNKVVVSSQSGKDHEHIACPECRMSYLLMRRFPMYATIVTIKGSSGISV